MPHFGEKSKYRHENILEVFSRHLPLQCVAVDPKGCLLTNPISPVGSGMWAQSICGPISFRKKLLVQDEQEKGQDYTLRRKGRKSKTCLGRMERAVSLLHCLISHQMFFLCRGVSSFFSPVPRRQMYIFPGSSYGRRWVLFVQLCVRLYDPKCFVLNSSDITRASEMPLSFVLSILEKSLFLPVFFWVRASYTLPCPSFPFGERGSKTSVFWGVCFHAFSRKRSFVPPFSSSPFLLPSHLRYMKTDARFVWRRIPFFRLPSSQFPWKKHNSTKKPKIESAFLPD